MSAQTCSGRYSAPGHSCVLCPPRHPPPDPRGGGGVHLLGPAVGHKELRRRKRAECGRQQQPDKVSPSPRRAIVFPDPLGTLPGPPPPCGHPFFPSHAASGHCVLTAAALRPALLVVSFPRSWVQSLVSQGRAGCCRGRVAVFAALPPPMPRSSTTRLAAFPRARGPSGCCFPRPPRNADA